MSGSAFARGRGQQQQTPTAYAADHHQPRRQQPVEGRQPLLPRPPQRDSDGDQPPPSLSSHTDQLPGAEHPGHAATAGTASEGVVKPGTACFNCRALRQKCDRKMPCPTAPAVRCGTGRAGIRLVRIGAGNTGMHCTLSNTHSATVDRLLSRIGETAERDQVVAALLNFAGVNHQLHGLSSHRPRSPQLQARHQQASRAPAAYEAPSSPTPSGPSVPPSSPPACALVGHGTSRKPANSNNSNNNNSYIMNLSSATTAAWNAAEPETLASLVSPLHIMAAAITADTAPYHRSPNSPMASSFLGSTAGRNLIDERLSRYFATQTTHQTDWQVLATQPIDSPLKLETSTCDPVAARLIDQEDVLWYFTLFFKYRSPLIGLLDPLLHTPEYVHASSFVLFSALCALGCAVSDRPRDRVVYPALLSLAEGNMKWAIAVCVKSIETIQSIIIMQYWAPVCQRQSDDPYWLRLSHAVQLARELGIHRPAAIAEQVNAVVANNNNNNNDACPDFTERLFRNFERTWLYTFISDKSFGIITGRSMGVAWKEIPALAAEWWRKPMTGPVDRIVSGIVEMRGLFLNAMERRKRVNNTLAAIAQWHAQAYRVLEQTRNARCTPAAAASAAAAAADSTLPSTRYLSVLAFYMDHSIMVLNAQALRDLIAIDDTGTSAELLHLSAENVAVASRLLDTMLHDPVLLELMVGFHNNQFIMVCHAATEILYAIQRGGLSMATVEQAAARVRAIPGHLDRIAGRLPATSAAHLYASLSRFFVTQLDKVVRNTERSNTARSSADNTDTDEGGRGADGGGANDSHSANSTTGGHATGTNDQDSLLADWWKTVDGGLLDSTTWMDMGFLTSEQPMLGSSELQEPGFNQSLFS
ncbi:fungal transcriptional regulatory protein [Niveomyces insectorum RCEF 264]|uniref:Fungal transcriptional regulatory protein n=1 Tax=Niveomyces insectorum RCEF 264 TaxID=1081102 RepID=A0A167WWZ3_9HYPO|nr:fungal transcriptional regulatory protein [Niveomyces insectorum RCEF 264]